MTDPPKQPKPTRRQVNVRLPLDLVEAIDARRARKDLSRDEWMTRALRFALEAPNVSDPATGELRTMAGRTAAPPHLRSRPLAPPRNTTH